MTTVFLLPRPSYILGNKYGTIFNFRSCGWESGWLLPWNHFVGRRLGHNLGGYHSSGPSRSRQGKNFSEIILNDEHVYVIY